MKNLPTECTLRLFSKKKKETVINFSLVYVKHHGRSEGSKDQQCII